MIWEDINIKGSKPQSSVVLHEVDDAVEYVLQLSVFVLQTCDLLDPFVLALRQR